LVVHFPKGNSMALWRSKKQDPEQIHQQGLAAFENGDMGQR